jgi:hypothetical protein
MRTAGLHPLPLAVTRASLAAFELFMVNRVRMLHVVFLGIVAAGAWIGLDFRRPEATWLELLGPKRASVRSVLPFQVRLNTPEASGNLHLDLHWTTADHEIRFGLASGKSINIRPEVREYSFAIPVPGMGPRRCLSHADRSLEGPHARRGE